MLKKVLPAAIAASLLAGVTAPAQADFSANIGYSSEYIFRGILQKNSSASAGLDFEAGGFYAGTWAADVGDGLEVDLYAGYVLELGDFNVGAGATGYYYTGDFDETYEEINLMAGWGILSVGYSIGTWDGDGGFDGEGGDEYTFLDITLEYEGFYGTYGDFGDDTDGSYFEVGYGTEIGGFDVGIAAIYSDDDLIGEDDEALVFSIGKTFDL